MSQRREASLGASRFRKKRGNMCTKQFDIDVDYPVKNLSFSQRRFQGFRGRTEFDKKRILVSGEHSISIYGYESIMHDSSYLLCHI